MFKKALIRIISLLVVIAFTGTVSCTTSQVHPLQAALPQEKVQGIKVGDTVKVTTYSGEKYQFKVEQITKELIAGEGIEVALADIDTIKKVRITGRTAAIVVGVIIAVALLIILGSNSSSYRGGERDDGASTK